MPATSPARPVRVPAATPVFWIVKILTTGVGETTSDFFVKSFDPVAVVLIGAVVFAVCFVIQFTARRYVPWRYWLFVTAVAVFGTMVADVTHIVLGVPYAVSTPVFGIVLAIILVLWRQVERTVSVHSISSGRRELFYWATVLATFALGTAFGDLAATTLRLGYLGSGIAFAVLFATPFGARRLGLGATACFWWAYIFTRPLGASFADWLAVAPARGGLGVGTSAISVIGLLSIAALVGVLQLRAGRSSAAALPRSRSHSR